jgi:uncharacterized protein (DUF58 family)
MRRFDPSELAKYGGLTLKARTIVEGFLAGIHRSPFKGYSVEFAEHRPYSPGDEIRRIDWHTYGKTDRYYVKEFEDETNLTAYLVVDSSASMRFRGLKTAENNRMSKFEYAQTVAASLAYLLLTQLDSVGLVIHDQIVRQHVPPKTSSKHLLAILHKLEQTEPKGETGLAEVWHSLAGRFLQQRGLVILISDGFDEVSKLGKAVQHLRHFGHDVVFINILAPEEITFPFNKPTKFRNFERPTEIHTVDTQRSDYRERFEQWNTELQKAFTNVQADRIILRTDESVDRILGTYLSMRAKR